MAFMGFWGTGVEPGTQYTEKVSCTVWKMMMMITTRSYTSYIYKYHTVSIINKSTNYIIQVRCVYCQHNYKWYSIITLGLVNTATRSGEQQLEDIQLIVIDKQALDYWLEAALVHTTSLLCSVYLFPCGGHTSECCYLQRIWLDSLLHHSSRRYHFIVRIQVVG